MIFGKLFIPSDDEVGAQVKVLENICIKIKKLFLILLREILEPQDDMGSRGFTIYSESGQ